MNLPEISVLNIKRTILKIINIYLEILSLTIHADTVLILYRGLESNTWIQNRAYRYYTDPNKVSKYFFSQKKYREIERESIDNK